MSVMKNSMKNSTKHTKDSFKNLNLNIVTLHNIKQIGVNTIEEKLKMTINFYKLDYK
jgi:hypothetical protein